MDFDFYLKVLKHRFNSNEEYWNMNLVYSDATFFLQKLNNTQILIRSAEIEVVIESSSSILSEVDDEFFEENINFSNLTRVVIIKNVVFHSAITTHLTKIFQLLLSYFHILLLFDHTYKLNIPQLELVAMQLDNVSISGQDFIVFCDPSAIM